MSNEQQYQEVKRRVRRIAEFYQHLGVYIVVNLGLAAINLISSPEDIWFVYPLIGWGIGVAAHGLKVFMTDGWSRSWEERKIRELMERESGIG
jgi:hypothetical protein